MKKKTYKRENTKVSDLEIGRYYKCDGAEDEYINWFYLIDYYNYKVYSYYNKEEIHKTISNPEICFAPNAEEITREEYLLEKI